MEGVLCQMLQPLIVHNSKEGERLLHFPRLAIDQPFLATWAESAPESGEEMGVNPK